MNSLFNRRDFMAEAVEKIRVYVEENPRSTRNDILKFTGCGIPDFQVAIEALGLVKHVSNGIRYWTVAPRVIGTPQRINVMKAPDYSPPRFEPPRAGSMDYKAIQSRGMPT